MLLVVDVGNTQTHFGTWEGERLVEHWRFATVRTATADEIGAVLLNLLELRGLSFADLDASIVSSTVPVLEPEWVAMAERYLDHRMLSVGPGLRTGMPIRYDNPREIGADRLVNAVAIRERFGGPAICVDFGTAVNFDVVSRAGEYLGGVLVPGVEISLDALTERGAKLPEDRPRAAAHGHRQVDGRRDPRRRGLRLRRGRRRHPAAHPRRRWASRTLRPIATGGLAQHIVPFTEEIGEVDQLLTLTGLRLVYERNAPPH